MARVPESTIWLACRIGNVFEFKEELECDFHGKLVVNNQNAFIDRGEAKTSIKNKDKAMQQMNEQALVIEFPLAIIFKDNPFQNIFKTYHLFFLKGEDDDQRNTSSDNSAAAQNVIYI
jgi:hypothetical protein